jgi:hypothetical protein
MELQISKRKSAKSNSDGEHNGNGDGERNEHD